MAVGKLLSLVGVEPHLRIWMITSFRTFILIGLYVFALIYMGSFNVIEIFLKE